MSMNRAVVSAAVALSCLILADFGGAVAARAEGMLTGTAGTTGFQSAT